MKKIILVLLSLAGLFAASPAFAQTDDLIITEYVDWQPGSGYFVKIYNPTAEEIDLGAYCFCQVNNGGLGNVGDCTELSGALAPGEFYVIGNNSEDCTPDQVNELIGVNGNDAVILKRRTGDVCEISNLDGVVDMVGNPSSDAFPNVEGVAEALKWHRLVRRPENCTRYTQDDGGARSWPTSDAEDFQGWIVEDVSCLSDTAPVIANGDQLEVSAGEDAVTCNTSFQLESTVSGGEADAAIWTQVSGPAQPNLDPQTGEIAALDTEGEYVFQFVAVNACGQAFADSVTLVIRFGGPLFRSVAKRNANAGAEDGAFVLNAFGATPPYRYSIDGQNFQNERIFRGLAPGRYTLYAQDAQGCTSSIEAEIK